MTGNDEATFANKLSLLDGQFTNIRKHFENNSVINVKLSKRQVANIEKHLIHFLKNYWKSVYQ